MPGYSKFLSSGHSLHQSLFRQRLHLVSLIIAAFFMSACSSLPMDTQSVAGASDPLWLERQARLATIKSWNLTGRLAVNNGAEAWNLDMNWQQYNGNYHIELSGPFGAGKVRLVGNEQGVVLHAPDDQTYQAERPDDLLYTTTGVTMPVEGLRYWIVGLATPGHAGKARLDDKRRLAYLEESNWEVKFRRYTTVNGMQLPDKIFIDRADREIDVRLVVDRWKINDINH